MDPPNPEKPKEVKVNLKDSKTEHETVPAELESNPIPEPLQSVENPSISEDANSTKAQIIDMIITDIDPNDNSIQEEWSIPRTRSSAKVESLGTDSLARFSARKTDVISLRAQNPGPSRNRQNPPDNVKVLLQKKLEKLNQRPTKPQETPENINVSSKVYASFVDWNNGNNPSSSKALQAQVQKVDKADSTGTHPRFDLSRSYSSEEDDKYTGLWTPETEKYWALQYSDVFERLASSNAENTNNNVILEMGQDRSGYGLDEKPRNGNGSEDRRQRPPQRHYAAHEPIERISYWANHLTDLGQPFDLEPYKMRRFKTKLFSSAPHPMDEAYNNPQYRARFTAKVLLTKAIQCFIIWGTLMGLQLSEKIADFHRYSLFLAYICVVGYTFLFIALRGSLLGESRRGCIIALILQTLCLIEIFASMQFNTAQIVICGIVLILALTFLVLASLSCLLKMDVVDSNNIYGIAAAVVLVITVFALLVLFIGSPDAPSIADSVRKIGGVFVPVLMSCESLILIELSELYQILRGFRLPLLKSDWIQATAHLL